MAMTSSFKRLLDQADAELLTLLEPAALTGQQLLTAGRQPLQNNPNSWEVTLNFDAEGAEAFADLTQSIAGSERLLAITLDNRLISAASVGPQFKSAGISGGAATISGNFDAETARELEVKLRGGSLPLPVEVVEVRTIGPTLGAENIRRSLMAALSGLALVAVFMVVAYRLPGVVAVVALSLYALFNLAVYALIPVTLTLPGIAGFILSIGMAVDANVLIFERIKDELRRGNTLIRSIDTGFSGAFSSILDGHLTTLDQLCGAVLSRYRTGEGIRRNPRHRCVAEPVHGAHLHPHAAAFPDGLRRPAPTHQFHCSGTTSLHVCLIDGCFHTRHRVVLRAGPEQPPDDGSGWSRGVTVLVAWWV